MASRRFPQLAWMRYGDPIDPEQLRRAAGRFRAAILQPWETQAAQVLKEADPTITVLAYQCLSSVRSYEPGPRYTSLLSPALAEELGTFATRRGNRIEWDGYPGHWQQDVGNQAYRNACIKGAKDVLAGTAFDGIFADNDVFDDYYQLRLPIDQIRDASQLRQALGTLIHALGPELARTQHLLVPNIAEARRSRGRWEEHSFYGGGVEECWMAWGLEPHHRLGIAEIKAQSRQLRAPGLSILRTPGTGEEKDPYLQLALAAAWVFAPSKDVAVTATTHDGYSGVPLHPAAGIDLGPARGPIRHNGRGVFTRRLAQGYAAINVGEDISTVGPRGQRVTLTPFRGYLWGAPAW
ncbi:putative glycoside hydrolase [Corynebacterium aquilae]|uniref:putative glycoside hydrolase n=1 Tax=Corynebacterium aquilae TaxID=203263 RepID=UPI0012EDFDCC|nr:putative glycoside hydrolase [Corynebacterium aquilae]